MYLVRAKNSFLMRKQRTTQGTASARTRTAVHTAAVEELVALAAVVAVCRVKHHRHPSSCCRRRVPEQVSFRQKTRLSPLTTALPIATPPAVAAI